MLRVSNLSFSYQSKLVFENVSLVLPEVGVVAVVGDNGVGKTTLLRLFAGELKPDDGSVKVHGTIGFLHQTQEDLVDLSGGEKTRLRLAELFRERPEVLLLDEPTNNLDTEAKRWLLTNLQKYRGLAIIVSHDRDFINQIAEKLLYLHDGRAEVFDGNYTDFQERQEQARHEQTLRYDRAQRAKKKLTAQLRVAVDHANKTNHHRFDKARDESKLHYNGKLVEAQKSAGKLLKATQSKLERLDDVMKPRERKTYAAKMDASFIHDRKLLEVRDLVKTFGEKALFRDLTFMIRTSERVRITGRNGAGKSTLFKIIDGEVRADSGTVLQADGMKMEYIAQDQLEFEMEKSFLEQSRDFETTEVYRAAATMDFSPEEMRRPVCELSRGQLTKLAILRLILQPIDLVILDEITNHLDIRARENIENALKNYPGAILMATHDEAFARTVGFEREIEL